MIKNIVILILIANLQNVCCFKQDYVLNLIREAGYCGAAYQTSTEDNGWVLKIHRIFPKNRMSNTMPVFLMHGIVVNAIEYVNTEKNKALPYFLSDNNFDVFMGNSRGSKYSYIDNKRGNYSNLWNFSFNEIGSYDIAAMIDYILHLTGKSKLFFIGHSQGTTSLLALLSHRPEYNSKIIQAHLFAPVAFMKYLPNPLKEIVIPFVDMSINNNLKYFYFKDMITEISPFIKILCNISINPHLFELCKIIFFMLVGPNTDKLEISPDLMLRLTDNVSPYLSVQQVNHYIQLHRSGKFRKYDYGPNNFQIYGTFEPPNYDLSKVKVPTYIYRAPNDYLTSKKDIDHLIKLLPNVKYNRVIPNYNHGDFNYGSRSREIIYIDVLHFLKSELNSNCYKELN